MGVRTLRITGRIAVQSRPWVNCFPETAIFFVRKAAVLRNLLILTTLQQVTGDRFKPCLQL
jgi:hypothetical protein